MWTWLMWLMTDDGEMVTGCTGAGVRASGRVSGGGKGGALPPRGRRGFSFPRYTAPLATPLRFTVAKLKPAYSNQKKDKNRPNLRCERLVLVIARGLASGVSPRRRRRRPRRRVASCLFAPPPPPPPHSFSRWRAGRRRSRLAERERQEREREREGERGREGEGERGGRERGRRGGEGERVRAWAASLPRCDGDGRGALRRAG